MGAEIFERGPSAEAIAAHFDALLATHETPDYPTAVNGLQVANRGPIVRIAAAVDASARTIDAAADVGANLLVVHHGLFWSGIQPIRGAAYARLRTLFDRDIAVYSAHLPLDRHPTLGNNALLARALGLDPTGGFARFESIDIGVRGETERPTAALVAAADAFATLAGGRARASAFDHERVTRRWAICTGAGADAATLGAAQALGIDTLIVGEGPHWTAVEAPERGLVIIYAGHYATETLGVRALAEVGRTTFGIPWTFIDAPTGL
ncbi:MAG TPA: Nif3-like dinuclear metal center hexameric protein [Gemmatimonadaceae bacterium]|jgi:dinuclear metal center YbgI/SA1388 family protein|nr:Nif3-like dinuclear metal center hexameric protein [Gemmatimonadaceae bacterium]